MFSEHAVSIPKECRRDLESDAKRLNKRIGILRKLYTAIAEFMASDERYYVFDRESEQSQMYQLIGGISIQLPKLEKEYDFILAEIEKEK